MGKLVAALFVMLAVAAIFAVVAWVPVWLLWNWLMPTIFGLPEISLWQALGVMLLAAFLFKSGGAAKS